MWWVTYQGGSIRETSLFTALQTAKRLRVKGALGVRIETVAYEGVDG